LDECGVVEAGPEPASDRQVDAVAQRGTNAATDEYDQETHVSSFVDGGNKKPPCGGTQRAPTALLRGRSHQPQRRVRGAPSPLMQPTLAVAGRRVNDATCADQNARRASLGRFNALPPSRAASARRGGG